MENRCPLNDQARIDQPARAPDLTHSAGGPPSVPFVLCVGVTGHRADVLPKGGIAVLRDRVRDVLLQIEESGRALLAAGAILSRRSIFSFASFRWLPTAPTRSQRRLRWSSAGVADPAVRATRYRASLANHGVASGSTRCWKRRSAY